MKPVLFDHTPTDMPTDNRPMNMGKSVNDNTSRLDGPAKVTGAAKYGRDMYLPDGLFVGFIRCPFGAAKLTASEPEAAKAVPGVKDVVMNGDEGRYHGHTVGYIVAESKHALRRAMKALDARWEQQPEVKIGINDGAKDPPPPTDATKAALDQADHVFEAEYSTPVQTHSSLETHGVVVDHKGDSAIVYASTQGTFSVRDGMADALKLPNSKFEVRCEYVGGGFGSKFGPGKEGTTAANVAAQYQRPVSLFVDRNEEHLDTGNRPSSKSMVKLGFRNDGTIIGGQIHTWGGVGVGGRGGGVRFPSERYALGEIQRSHEDVSFNAGAPRAMRAPGHPQGAFAEELAIDEIATIAGVDPLELRLKLDGSEDRREMYRLGAELIGWKNRRKTGSQMGTIRRGFGMGSCSWGGGRSPADAEVIINRDGSVIVRTGTQDIGSGMRTIAGVLVADRLGVPLANIDVQIGSSNYPEGPASGGSTTSPNTCPAIVDAADDARTQLLKTVADRTGANPDQLKIVNGEVRNSEQKVGDWADTCAKMPADTLVGRGRKQQNQPHPGEGHSHGAQFVDLEVDIETGVVRVNKAVAIQACGRVVSRKTAESQIIGGVIQGISFALFERQILDRVTGACVNANLEQYKILGSADMPHIVPVLWDKGQTGVRSLGEPPVIPGAAMVACAVFNAIGAPVRHLPITPDKVLAALDLAKKGGAA